MERSGDKRDRAELVRDRPFNHPAVAFIPDCSRLLRSQDPQQLNSLGRKLTNQRQARLNVMAK